MTATFLCWHKTLPNKGDIRFGQEAFLNGMHKAYFLTAHTGLFISPSGISELDCATTKTDTAERSISIGREFLQVFFLY